MGIHKMGGEGLELLTRLMQASSLRSKVVAGNLANQNTPGYVRKVVDFEGRLRAALADDRPTDRVELEVLDDPTGPTKPDGNNVTMETELNASRENRLAYETYATVLEAHFRLIDSAIQEGR